MQRSCVDHSKDLSKHTFLIHDSGHLSDECKVLGDIGYKYSKVRRTKDQVHDLVTRNKFNMQKNNTAIVNHALNKNDLQENKK